MLAKQNIEVYVLACQKNALEPAPLYECRSGVHIFRSARPEISFPTNVDEYLFQNSMLVSIAGRLLSNLRKDTVIHAHDWFVAPAAITLQDQFGCPLVVTPHYLEASKNLEAMSQRYSTIAVLQQLLSEHATKIIVFSDFLANSIQKTYHINPQKIISVRCGFDDLEPVYDRRPCLLETPVVLFVGRLSDSKDIPTLMRAMKIVIRRRPETLLKLAGAGKEEAMLKRLAAKLGIEANCHFLGLVAQPDQLARLYLEASLLVLPSRYETLGLVLLEAGSLGVPVVASDVGGPREIIGSEDFGLLFPVGDHKELARKILEVLDNPEIAKRRAARLKERVKSIYRWDLMACQLKDIYTGLSLE